MGIVFMLIFGIPSAIIAAAKGFKPLRWIIALGIIGLITVAVLPSANANGINADEMEKRTENANSVGAWMAGINVVLSVLFIFIILGSVR